MEGLIIEDIVDTVLDNGNVQRVSNNKNVFIIKNNTILKSYSTNNLAPIKSRPLVKSNRENPNIGVIDFETMRITDNTSKVYACGFKTFLDEEVYTYIFFLLVPKGTYL
jgi:hypothetical protein